ncbi:MAG: pyruvate kinase [Alphaproteobacteria bacterium]|nr:pyruvate kinase [Alphaproteobacteria bacterium]
MHTQLTKIVATIGPATSSIERIRALAKAGVSVFRMNFSHGDYQTHQNTYNAIRSVAKENHTYYSILADMQGPKLRVSDFKEGKVTLKTGKSFTLDMKKELGDETRVGLFHPEIYKAVQKGMILLLNDGLIRLKIKSVTDDCIETSVLVGGELSNHKGVNVPDVALPIAALTAKDKKDLDFALNLGVDWICLSFVQKPEDVVQARSIIKNRAGIIVKIEKPAALNHLDEIIDLTDAVMVARGDLGVECPLETVPALQRNIVLACREKGKPVIVATQMLESMIKSPSPTRAEVSDVSTAVYEGADCVMLSAETAVGEYPIEAVKMMHKIIMSTQKDDAYHAYLEASAQPSNDKSISSAITSSMRQMVKSLKHPDCVITFSVSGKTALRAAKERLGIPILNLTVSEKVANQMALVWGVRSIVTDSLKELIMAPSFALKIAKETKMAKVGDEVIISAGIPFGTQGSTNVIHITKVE